MDSLSDITGGLERIGRVGTIDTPTCLLSNQKGVSRPTI